MLRPAGSALADVALDGVNDPKIGMVGASYGGGIQLASAVYDHRIDAIVPTIAWNSLTDVLFPREAVRSGWATLLSSVLVLTLSDIDGRRVGARAFGPGEYMGEATLPATIASGAEATVDMDILEPAPDVVAFTFDFR